MRYTVTQSKDPEMYEFWNEYTVAKQSQPMLCFIVHSDCLTASIPMLVKQHGEIEVEFEVIV